MKRARIVVLVIALGAGGLAAKLAKMSDVPPPPPIPQPTIQIDTVDVLVASSDIGMGQVLSAQNISWQNWPAATAGEFIKKTSRPGAIQELDGTRARTDIAAGEPIQESRLVKAGSGFLAAVLHKGMRAVAAEITPDNGVGGFVLPGDRVDVILTRTPPGGRGDEGSVSNTILWNVRVLAIDHDINVKNGANTAVGKITTFELTSRQAEKLELARRLGTISLVLRGQSDDVGSSEDDGDSLGKADSVDVVRYGVRTTIR